VPGVGKVGTGPPRPAFVGLTGAGEGAGAAVGFVVEQPATTTAVAVRAAIRVFMEEEGEGANKLSAEAGIRNRGREAEMNQMNG
jgi:hypothetical protein